jgi:hypothetical protein
MRRRGSAVAVWTSCLLAAALTGWFLDASGQSLDTEYFLRASRVLLSAHWLTTFSAPGLQAGPFEVAGLGAAARLGHLVGASGAHAIAALQSVLLVGLLLGAANVLAAPRRRTLAIGLVGAGALATGTIGGAYLYGHPAEVVNPALWVLAACAVRRRRSVLGGALVALSAGFETWGVLGLAVLAIDPRPRQLLRASAAFTALLCLTYGPFVVFGSFRMFSYRWNVGSDTLPGLLGIGPRFPWSLRLVQATAAGLAGTVAAWSLRRSRIVCWLAPLCAVWTRSSSIPSSHPGTCSRRKRSHFSGRGTSSPAT